MKKIAGSLSSASRASEKMDSSIKKMGYATSHAANKSSTAMNKMQSAVIDVSQKTKKMGESSQKTSEKIMRLMDTQKRTATTARQFRMEIGKLSDSNLKLSKTTVEAEKKTGLLRRAFIGLGQVASRMATSIKSSLGGISPSVDSLTRRISSGVTNGIIAPFRSAIGMVKQYAGVLGLLSGGALASSGMGRLSAIENARTSLEVMMGDTKTANEFLDEVLAFAKTTPFAFPDLAESSRNLIAFGMDSKKVVPTLKAIGDAAAATGKGAEGLNQVAGAFGDMQISSELSLGPIRSLEAAGVPALKILANQAGISADEMAKRISKGSVNSKEAIDNLVKGMQEGTNGLAGPTAAMAGIMEKTKKNWTGSVDSLKSSISSTMAKMVDPAKPHIQNAMAWFGNQFSKLPDVINSVWTTAKDAGATELFKSIKDGAMSLVNTIQTHWPTIKDHLKGTIKIIVDIGLKIKEHWKPIKEIVIAVTAGFLAFKVAMSSMAIINTVTSMITGLNNVMRANPATLVVAGITSLITIGVYLYRNWDIVKEKAKELWNYLIELKDAAVEKLREKIGFLIDKLVEFKDKVIDVKDNAIQTISDKINKFKGFLEENKTELIATASVLGTIFGPALVKVGIQAAVAGGKIAFEFTVSLIKSAAQAIVTASVLTSQFIVSLIKTSTQAVVTGARITASLIASLIKTATQAIVTSSILTGQFVMALVRMSAQALTTAATITGSLIVSLARFAAQGWMTVAAITAQTTAWLIQKGAMIASAAVTGAMTAAQWALNAALNANPIGMVIMLIGLLVAAGVYLYQNWDTVKTKAAELWSWLDRKFAAIRDSVTEKLQPVMNFFTSLIKTWDAFKTSVASFKMPTIGLPKWLGGNGLIQMHGSHATGLNRVPFDGYRIAA